MVCDRRLLPPPKSGNKQFLSVSTDFNLSFKSCHCFKLGIFRVILVISKIQLVVELLVGYLLSPTSSESASHICNVLAAEKD